MALRSQPVPIPLGGGVDEATSDVLFEAPLVREAINARIPKTGSIGKRYGEDALPSGLPDYATYGEPNAIVEQDGRAVVLSQLGAYAHDPVRSTWAQLGAVSPRPSRAVTDRLVRQNNSSAEPEIALVTVNSRTLACIVWSDTDLLDGYYMWAEVPSDGGQLRVVSGPTLFGGTRKFAYSIRLAVIGTTVYAIAGDEGITTNVYTSKCDASSTYTFSTPSTIAWATSANPVALLSDGSSLLWAVINESGGGYSIRKLSTSFVEAANVVVAGAVALDAIRNSTTLVIIKSDGSLDTVADSLPGAPTNTAVVTVGAGGPLYAAATRATLVLAGSSYFCAWSRPATAQAIESFGVVIASVTTGLSVTTSGVVGSVLLAGRAGYRSAEGLPVLPILDVVNTTYWRCAYLARPATGTDGLYTLAEVCRFSSDVAMHQPSTTTGARTTSRSFNLGGFTTAHVVYALPSIVYDSVSGQWLFPHQVIADTATPGVNGTIVVGVDMLRCATTTAPAERSVSASDLRILGGGCGATYLDGPVHAEMTPPPIGLYNTDQTDSAGIFYTGTAAEADSHIILAARWRDEKGNLHRGAPLFVLSASMYDDAPAGDNEAVRVRFPRPFPQTIRGDKGGQTYEVEVYMAATSAGPFYFADVVTPEAHPSILGVDYILVSDPLGGGIASAQRPAGADYIADLYDRGSFPSTAVPRWTDSGELVHVPCPPCIDLCSTQSRVWLLLGEQGRNLVRPSKLLTPGYAPEFPSSLDVVVPSEGGECVAIAALVDKVVVFKQRLIYVLFGDPGDNTGAGSTLQTPRLVPTDVGCSQAQSVVEGPFGVVFRGAAGGFHLLGPDAGAVTNLPALEDSLGTDTIISGALVADRKEVRWATSGSRTLVWDYQANAWLTHTHTLATVHATTVRGLYTRIASGGNVYAERYTWSTSLDTHELKLTSAWLKLSGTELPTLQGFKRVWKTLLLGRWYSGDLIVRIGVDYEPEWAQTETWTAAELGALDASDGTVQIEIQHTRQKCEAVRFQIEEANPSSQSPPPRGQGFTVLGATLVCGVKRGHGGKLFPAAARK